MQIWNIFLGRAIPSQTHPNEGEAHTPLGAFSNRRHAPRMTNRPTPINNNSPGILWKFVKVREFCGWEPYKSKLESICTL